jgi:hypothetical protein
MGQHRVLGRLLEVQRRGQLVVLDLDELGGVARLRRGAGHHHGDDLAGEADPVDRDRRVGRRLLLRRDRPGVDAHPDRLAEVGGGDHVHDAHRVLGRTSVDAGDPGMGEGAAHHRQVQHPGQGDVVGPAGAAGDQPGVLLAAARRTDLCGRALFGRGHDTRSRDAARTALTMFW